jgi:hypothetical protein
MAKLDRTLRAFGVASALLAFAATSFADQRDPVAAEALFRQARQAFKKGDLATACPKFAESHRLDPAVGTLVNLAQCEQKSGMLASAWQHWREASEQLPAGDERIAIAKHAIEELEPRVPHLTIALAPGAPKGTKVLRKGVELGPASLGSPLPVDPGELEIEVRAPGHASRRYTVKMSESGDDKLVVEPGEPEPVAPPAATTSTKPAIAPEQPLPPPKRDATIRSIGYVVGGAGLVGLGVGVVFSLQAKSKDDKSLKYCDGSTCNDPAGMDLTEQSQSAARIAAIAYVAGGALTVGGLVMILVGSKEEPPNARSVSLRPSLGPGHAGLNIGGRW